MPARRRWSISSSTASCCQRPWAYAVGMLPRMSNDQAQGVVVWTRDFDRTASRRRWKNFGVWFLAPLLIALVLALALGGAGAFLGVLILVGGIGALIALLLWLYDKALMQNPEIRLVDGQLRMGRRAVAVEQIESWTTHRRTKPARSAGGVSPVAQAIFRVPVMREGTRGTRPDGGPAFDTVHFGWGEMSAEELDGVRKALDAHVAAPWVPLERLRELDFDHL